LISDSENTGISQQEIMLRKLKSFWESLYILILEWRTQLWNMVLRPGSWRRGSPKHWKQCKWVVCELYWMWRD